MTPANALKWWPPIGILAMILLGLAVGVGSTRLDDWFIRTGHSHRHVDTLLVSFAHPLLLGTMLVVTAVAAAYRRRWRLAVVVALTPLFAALVVRLLKPLFGRELDGLAYPSGHVTVMVTVLGMVVLVAGARVWLLVAAAVFALLGMVGLAFTYHYFTDTVGAALLGTALVCLAVPAAGLDRCQPECDLRHSNG